MHYRVSVPRRGVPTVSTFDQRNRMSSRDLAVHIHLLWNTLTCERNENERDALRSRMVRIDVHSVSMCVRVIEAKSSAERIGIYSPHPGCWDALPSLSPKLASMQPRLYPGSSGKEFEVSPLLRFAATRPDHMYSEKQSPYRCTRGLLA